jgi:hypothetical protein
MSDYLGSYLFEVLGMRPRQAASYLRNSIAAQYKHTFRSFRIQVDRKYDPRTEVLEDPMADYTEGRVTFKVKRDAGRLVITHAYLEYGGRILRAEDYRPRSPEPSRSPEVFVLGPPRLLKPGERLEILSVIPSSRPVRGWFIEGIESMHVMDRAIAIGTRVVEPLPPPPPVKTPVRPHFIEVLAPFALMDLTP